MTIKNNFKNMIGERSITSFDFLDFAKGKAIQSWFGLNGRTEYALHEVVLYSDDIETYGTMVNTSNLWGEKLNVDLDVTFDKPQIIDGEVAINIVLGMNHTGNASAAQTYLIAKLRHWDGTTETELGSAQSETIGANTTQNDRMNCLLIDVARTKFKKGDTFRLTVEVWGMCSGASTFTWFLGFGHDPKNRQSPLLMSATQQTALQLAVPFRIDL